MKPIILDCDGVLLDWEHMFQRWCQTNHKIKFTSARPTSWDLSEWTGLPADRVFELIQHFNKSATFQQCFEYTEAAVVLRQLWQKGHSLYVVSCYDSGGKSVQNRTWNLHQKFGNIFEEIVSLPLRHSKEPALKELYERLGECVFIEDNPEYALQGAAQGHDCYVLRRDHNRHLEKGACYDYPVTWVDNFYQIRELINEH